MREVALRGAARAYYALMSGAERAAIDQATRLLEQNAQPDGLITFEVPGLPSLRVYDDGTWQMVYVVPDEATVVIRSIAHALDLPE